MHLHIEGGGSVSVPRALMQAFLQQDPNHPGLETVRLPSSSGDDDKKGHPHRRDVEVEVCLVCRRCGKAYPEESSLLSHQRSCYLGNQQRRGALRVVEIRFACTLCGDKNPTSDWRRHAESPQHRFHAGLKPEDANPLTDEMEDVVNQITLLAARAAAESTTTTQDNNNVASDVKAIKELENTIQQTGAR